VYSNCRVRQSALNSAPRPGKICSDRAATGRTSNTARPSNAMARIFALDTAAITGSGDSAIAAAPTPMKFTNSLRFIALTSFCFTRLTLRITPDPLVASRSLVWGELSKISHDALRVLVSLYQGDPGGIAVVSDIAGSCAVWFRCGAAHRIPHSRLT